MSELQLITSTKHNVTEQIELQSFDLPQNYSLLINKLEQLALGLDSAFGNLSLDRKEVDIAFSTSSSAADIEDYLDIPVAAGRAPPPHSHAHGMGGGGEVEFTHVVSDIWIGVILTLLIVSVIFFICACFLYHKFQQWKNSYRTSHSDPIEICRRYPPDYEAESLPSYTIVSGLPSYDDALEEFRKAGIILTPPIPVIKIFDSDAKNASIFNIEDALHDITVNGGNSNTINATADNISLSSTCTCGANSAAPSSYYNPVTPNNSMMSLCLPPGSSAATQIIELSPEQLAALSQKRLSLQIAFNSSVRRSSRPRIDLYREANRNNHFRSRAMSNAGLDLPFPEVHRRASSSLSLERNGMPHMQHRGSLC